MFDLRNLHAARRNKYNTGMNEALNELAGMLLNRLEHLSVDSRWARRASGLRRSLLSTMDAYLADPAPSQELALKQVMEYGFYIIENAAREMGDRPINPPVS